MSILHQDIAAIREEYKRGSLSESDVALRPVVQFEKWLAEAIGAQVAEPTAMVLSTVDADGVPSSRVVLLKDVAEKGFTFFTNYESKKGHDIAVNPTVSLLFFWSELQRQVRVVGTIQRLDAQDSDEYFQSRPRGSRLGAIASPQSSVIPDREYLESRVQAIEADYQGKDDIARPTHWGGYVVSPLNVEFWQGRESRLHDRLVYSVTEGEWELKRLAP